MTTTYTIHTVGCAAAVEMNGPIVASADYPDARKHRCVYYVDPVPDQVRVTSTEEEVPPAPEESQ
jgi:hypothetical protein